MEEDKFPTTWQAMVGWPPWEMGLKPLLQARLDYIEDAMLTESDPVMLARYQGAGIELKQQINGPEKAQALAAAFRRQVEEQEEKANESRRRTERGWQLFPRR